MQITRTILATLVLSLFVTSPVWSQEPALTADSLVQEGVPQGKIVGPIKFVSQVFPGTERHYWVYVPEQYNPETPACVLVVQDGLGMANGWKLPQVLDNLIHKKEIPVQIGIFIEPGVLPAPHENAQPRFNRSYEYDSLGDRYARFLIEEMLPEVQKSYNLSSNPDDRAIAGASSGAICAFNVAWERPDQFRRVLSTIGTYVGLRGADNFPVLIRKTDPKPLRVFLQDGTQDLNLYAGEWFVANQNMLSALKYSGYEVDHAWGEGGGHDSKHASVIMPDAVRFIWENYPEPVKLPAPQKGRVDVLIEGEGWQEVSSGHEFTEGPIANAKGEVFFTDIPQSKIHKIGLDGQVSVFVENSMRTNGLCFGPDGKLYACETGSKKIVRYDDQGNKEDVVTDVVANDIIVLANGNGFFTVPAQKQVWWFNTAGESKVIDTGIERPNGLAASPDQSLLCVADSAGRMTWSFQIQGDGSLAHKQTFGWLHLTDTDSGSAADGVKVDTLGNTYVCTRAGLQVIDQAGRVNVILNKPSAGPLANVVFGGPEHNVLYVTCGDKVFKRQVKTQGVRPWEAPITPPRPAL